MYESLKELCQLDKDFERGDWIIEKLNKLGADIEIQNFPKIYEDDISHRNIISRIREGSPSYELALCAHYDKYPFCNTQGALDNGAALVELLNVYERILNNAEDFDITFLFFDVEEIGQKGAQYFVDNHKRKIFDAVYNIDLVGKGDAMITSEFTWSNFSNNFVSNSYYLNKIINHICEDKKIPFYIVKKMPPADNALFRFTAPATIISTFPKKEAELWSNGANPWTLPTIELIHTPNDTIDEVDPQTLIMMSDFLYDLVNFYRSS